MRISALIATTLCIATTLLAFDAPPLMAKPDEVAASPTGTIVLEDLASIRAAYGLSAGLTDVAKLVASPADVGTPVWGIPLTEAELDSLDIGRRNAFAGALASDLVPYVRSLNTYAGVWLDQPHGGRVVVQLTRAEEAQVARILALEPSPSLGVDIEVVTYSRRQLEDAVRTVARGRAQLAGASAIRGVGIDTPANRLVVQVASDEFSMAEVVRASVEKAVNVPTEVVPAPRGGDATAVCTDRDHCYNPMKGGDRIHRGSSAGQTSCTMGFMVVQGAANIEFLTAGHCASLVSGTSWYHQGYGLLGTENGSAYGEDGYDVMKVNMPDAQKSELVYGVSGPQDLTGARDPITGEGVCFSGATTEAIRCGTVTDDLWTWVSETCDCNVWGGDTNLAPIPGDSGAPLYSRSYITGATSLWRNTPIGVVDHQNGGFAWVTAAEWVLGVSAYH